MASWAEREREPIQIRDMMARLEDRSKWWCRAPVEFTLRGCVPGLRALSIQEDLS
jgi:hypothetical protein